MFAPCNPAYYSKLGNQRSSDSIQRVQAAAYLYGIRFARSSLGWLVFVWRKSYCALRPYFRSASTLIHVADVCVGEKLAKSPGGKPKAQIGSYGRATARRGCKSALGCLSVEISQLHRGIPPVNLLAKDMPRKAVDEYRSAHALGIGLDWVLIQAQLPRGERRVWGETPRVLQTCTASTTASNSQKWEFMKPLQTHALPCWQVDFALKITVPLKAPYF